jgi:hypothetical protein
LDDFNPRDLETLLTFVETGEDVGVLCFPNEKGESSQVTSEVMLELVLRPLPTGSDGEGGIEPFGGMKGPVINHFRVILILLHGSSINEELDFGELD